MKMAITPMTRRWTNLIASDVQKLCDITPPEKYAHGEYSDGPNCKGYSDALVGKSLTFRFDEGLVLNYSFNDLHCLSWNDGGEEHTDYCDVTEGAENVYLITHFVKESIPPKAHMIVVDLDNGLVTATIAKLCQIPDNAREAVRDFYVGLTDGYADPGYRHEFTEDMVGKAIYWHYFDEEPNFTIKHIYVASNWYTVCGVKNGKNSWAASNPCAYIKIRKGVYIFTFTEDRQAGSQCFFLMDLIHMHDTGCFFGCATTGLECYTVGAKGEWTTPWSRFSNTSAPEKAPWEE